MTRAILFSVALSGLLIYGILRLQATYEARQPELLLTRIDIYADRITYRTGSYATPSSLEIGLKAAQDQPETVALHDCARMDDFEVIVDTLRSLGYSSFDVELPQDC